MHFASEWKTGGTHHLVSPIPHLLILPESVVFEADSHSLPERHRSHSWSLPSSSLVHEHEYHRKDVASWSIIIVSIHSHDCCNHLVHHISSKIHSWEEMNPHRLLQRLSTTIHYSFHIQSHLSLDSMFPLRCLLKTQLLLNEPNVPFHVVHYKCFVLFVSSIYHSIS